MYCRYALVLALGAVPMPGHAESLRCGGGIVSEGDSRLSLFYKCGPPAAADSFCAPVYFAQPGNLVPVPWSFPGLPCQVIEQLLYERGPGEFVATVYVRQGVVQSISYGRAPR